MTLKMFQNLAHFLERVKTLRWIDKIGISGNRGKFSQIALKLQDLTLNNDDVIKPYDDIQIVLLRFKTLFDK